MEQTKEELLEQIKELERELQKTKASLDQMYKLYKEVTYTGYGTE